MTVVNRELAHLSDEALVALAARSEQSALAELYDVGVDNPQFNARLSQLAEAVITHATREENEEFRYLRENLPEDRLRRMAGALQAAQKLAPTRPHPSIGESATANLLVGPPAAVFDRIRDAVRDWRQSHPDD